MLLATRRLGMSRNWMWKWTFSQQRFSEQRFSKQESTEIFKAKMCMLKVGVGFWWTTRRNVGWRNTLSLHCQVASVGRSATDFWHILPISMRCQHQVGVFTLVSLPFPDTWDNISQVFPRCLGQYFPDVWDNISQMFPRYLGQYFPDISFLETIAGLNSCKLRSGGNKRLVVDFWTNIRPIDVCLPIDPIDICLPNDTVVWATSHKQIFTHKKTSHTKNFIAMQRFIFPSRFTQPWLLCMGLTSWKSL